MSVSVCCREHSSRSVPGELGSGGTALHSAGAPSPALFAFGGDSASPKVPHLPWENIGVIWGTLPSCEFGQIPPAHSSDHLPLSCSQRQQVSHTGWAALRTGDFRLHVSQLPSSPQHSLTDWIWQIWNTDRALYSAVLVLSPSNFSHSSLALLHLEVRYLSPRDRQAARVSPFFSCVWSKVVLLSLLLLKLYWKEGRNAILSSVMKSLGYWMRLSFFSHFAWVTAVKDTECMWFSDLERYRKI